MNYFYDVKNIDDLRKKYLNYSKKLHPDCGGTHYEFIFMRKEYVEKLKILNKKEKSLKVEKIIEIEKILQLFYEKTKDFPFLHPFIYRYFYKFIDIIDLHLEKIDSNGIDKHLNELKKHSNLLLSYLESEKKRSKFVEIVKKLLSLLK